MKKTNLKQIVFVALLAGAAGPFVASKVFQAIKYVCWDITYEAGANSEDAKDQRRSAANTAYWEGMKSGRAEQATVDGYPNTFGARANGLRLKLCNKSYCSQYHLEALKEAPHVGRVERTNSGGYWITIGGDE